MTAMAAPLRRTHVVKYRQTSATPSKEALFKLFRGKLHRHFCSDRECRLFYQDACATPETNEVCPACRGLTRPYFEWMDPRECCINNCEQVTNRDDLRRYQLAGPGPWFQCQTCFRTHGWPCVA